MICVYKDSNDTEKGMHNSLENNNKERSFKLTEHKCVKLRAMMPSSPYNKSILLKRQLERYCYTTFGEH